GAVDLDVPHLTATLQPLDRNNTMITHHRHAVGASLLTARRRREHVATLRASLVNVDARSSDTPRVRLPARLDAAIAVERVSERRQEIDAATPTRLLVDR